MIFQMCLELAEDNILELGQNKTHFFPRFFSRHGNFVEWKDASFEVIKCDLTGL